MSEAAAAVAIAAVHATAKSEKEEEEGEAHGTEEEEETTGMTVEVEEEKEEEEEEPKKSKKSNNSKKKKKKTKTTTTTGNEDNGDRNGDEEELSPAGNAASRFALFLDSKVSKSSLLVRPKRAILIAPVFERPVAKGRIRPRRVDDTLLSLPIKPGPCKSVVVPVSPHGWYRTLDTLFRHDRGSRFVRLAAKLGESRQRGMEGAPLAFFVALRNCRGNKDEWRGAIDAACDCCEGLIASRSLTAQFGWHYAYSVWDKRFDDGIQDLVREEPDLFDRLAGFDPELDSLVVFHLARIAEPFGSCAGFEKPPATSSSSSSSSSSTSSTSTSPPSPDLAEEAEGDQLQKHQRGRKRGLKRRASSNE